MNKRLIWNFEINMQQVLNCPNSADNLGDLHWEKRFFWPDDAVILLNGLDESFLNLAQYQIKNKHDVYFLLPDTNYNIKLRRDAIFYKPLLKRSDTALAFGKKIKLDDNAIRLLPTDDEDQTLNSSLLLQQIRANARKVAVEKEALIYRFPALLNTKLELARLRINQEVFFSVSLESPVLSVVESLTKQLINRQDFSDYITFLKAHCS